MPDKIKCSAQELTPDKDRCFTEHAQSNQTSDPETVSPAFAENLPAMFYAVEPHAPYAPIHLSPAFESLGYPLAEWHNHPDLWLRLIHPDDRVRILAATKAATREGGEVDYEYRLTAKDGTVHYVRDRGCFLRDRNGEKICWQGVILDITERKKAIEALKESEARYREIFENAYDVIYTHDLEGNYISINKAAERIFGYSRDEVMKMNMEQVLAPEYLLLARQKMHEKIAAGIKQTAYEIECIGRNGHRVTLEVNSSIIYQDNRPVGVQGIARDITERKRAQEALRESEERYRDLFENANDLIYTIDIQGNFTSLNRAGEKITGYTREEALSGKVNMAQVVAPEYLDKVRRMMARKLEGEQTATYDVEIITKYGYRVFLELSTRLIFQKGAPIGIQGIGRDVTERKRTQKQLLYNALHDALTNLPNRTEFMNCLRMTINDAARDNERTRFAVLFLDLDRFKLINDTLGHLVGDKLLIAIAERLKNCVRPGDVVARLGGDEFTVLLNRIAEESDVIRIVERIQHNLSKPFKIDNYEIFTSASIGIIASDEMRREAEDFLRDADTAMYRAKEAGKARYEVFDTAMHVRNMNLLRVENDLRRAIERREFRVFYQPIVELEKGNVCEFEALIRWQHPEFGLVMPNEFVSVAEETGLIIPIGEWILEETCRQNVEWQKRFPRHRALSVSVNLSAKQLMHPSLIRRVGEILAKTGMDPRCLNLEVTESIVMEHSDTALDVLHSLCKMGVSFSTDDFGTGYSSLSYLHRFPFERLKIDRSFVGKMDSDPKSEEIVRTILTLAENLHLEVVAEGIETEKQFLRLRELGCHLGQGYLFSKPVPAAHAEKILADGLEHKMRQELADAAFAVENEPVMEVLNVQ